MSSFVMERYICVVCLRQGKLMENHFVCVSQPLVFQGHKNTSYVSSLTLLKAMHCAVAAGRACSFEDHFIKPRKA